MSTTDNKQDIVRNTIIAGGATKDILLNAGWPGIDKKAASASLASVFTGLRMAAKFAKDVPLCPVTDENGVYSFVTHDVWMASQTEKAPKVPQTPQQIHDAAIKRVVRAEKALIAAETRNDSNPTTRNALYFRRAEIDLEIAKFELDDARVDLEESIYEK